MIYTTNFAHLRKLPQSIIPVSIARYPLQGYDGLVYNRLAPTPRMLCEYRATGDTVRFTDRYIEDILGSLDPSEIIAEIEGLVRGSSSDLCDCGGNLDIALVCFERATSFCHRHIVAKWFNSIGIDCKEWEG